MTLIRFMAGLLGSPDSLGIPTNNASTDALSSILNTVYFFVGAIAILMLVIAGINYVRAGGDSNNVVKAKNTILGTIIGIIIILSAFLITNFVISGMKGSAI